MKTIMNIILFLLSMIFGTISQALFIVSEWFDLLNYRIVKFTHKLNKE